MNAILRVSRKFAHQCLDWNCYFRRSPLPIAPTKNPEPRTQNPEPRTQNPEPRTQNSFGNF
ncbi:hypothetical protein DLH96_25005 [Vibrio parahaemolyticus]|nr:hypothetical protein [Vibrio parahaemolyticus]